MAFVKKDVRVALGCAYSTENLADGVGDGLFVHTIYVVVDYHHIVTHVGADCVNGFLEITFVLSQDCILI